MGVSALQFTWQLPEEVGRACRIELQKRERLV